jgi:hypothetical protein
LISSALKLFRVHTPSGKIRSMPDGGNVSPRPRTTHLVAKLDQRLREGQGQGPQTGAEPCTIVNETFSNELSRFADCSEED